MGNSYAGNRADASIFQDIHKGNQRQSGNSSRKASRHAEKTAFPGQKTHRTHENHQTHEKMGRKAMERPLPAPLFRSLDSAEISGQSSGQL